jgi:hypothetical protein
MNIARPFKARLMAPANSPLESSDAGCPLTERSNRSAALTPELRSQLQRLCAPAKQPTNGPVRASGAVVHRVGSVERRHRAGFRQLTRTQPVRTIIRTTLGGQLSDTGKPARAGLGLYLQKKKTGVRQTPRTRVHFGGSTQMMQRSEKRLGNANRAQVPDLAS